MKSRGDVWPGLALCCVSQCFHLGGGSCQSVLLYAREHEENWAGHITELLH